MSTYRVADSDGNEHTIRNRETAIAKAESLAAQRADDDSYMVGVTFCEDSGKYHSRLPIWPTQENGRHWFD